MELTLLKKLILIKQVFCYYCLFLKHIFKFEPNVYNRCYDLLMVPMNLSNTDILSIKSSDYCCIISLISKNETTNLI